MTRIWLTPDAAIAYFTQVAQSSSELKVKAQAFLLRGSTYRRKADNEHAMADFLTAIALSADPFIRDRADANLRVLGYRPPHQIRCSPLLRSSFSTSMRRTAPAWKLSAIVCRRTAFTYNPKI